MADSHKNFAYSTVATAPSPASTGTSLEVTAGHGTRFPTAPFNATVWPAGEQPTSTNAEIVRVTNISTDTFTITREQEDTRTRTIIVGDQIAASITNHTLVEAENIMSRWSPYILGSAGTGVQTLASNYTAQTGTGSLYVFPVTARNNVNFAHIVLVNQLSMVTSATGAISNTYVSKFGLYSMNGNTLSLITSNSFSIGVTLQRVSLSMYYPTSTHSNGYSYGSFAFGRNLTTSGEISSYISGSRAVGLNFNRIVRLDEGIYWVGIMSQRSTANSSTFGLSNVGIVGQIINQFNSVGSVSGMNPLGVAATQWSSRNSHSSAWFGRHIVGFVTNTATANQLGTAIPSAIELSQLGAIAANSTASILPSVSFINFD